MRSSAALLILCLTLLVTQFMIVGGAPAPPPIPPTATPVPPTATPIPPTATAVPPTATSVPQPVLEVVGPSGSKSLTLEDLENDTLLREALECQAARVCAEKASDSALARLKTQARRLDKLMAEGDPPSQLGRVTHQEFHLAIARASTCTSLADELQRIWFRRLMWMNWIKATHYRRVPANWHQQLVAALARRDPDRAEAKMREHVRYGREDDREALTYFLEHSGDLTTNGVAARP